MKKRNNTRKDRKGKKRIDLHLDLRNEALQQKWSPKTDCQLDRIARPLDIARKFQVGIAEVIAKIKILGFGDISRNTKLPAKLVNRILLEGNNPDFWPTIISQQARIKADPKSIGYAGKRKKAGHIKPSKTKDWEASKSGPQGPPILTPVGGQPGYRIKRQYI